PAPSPVQSQAPSPAQSPAPTQSPAPANQPIPSSPTPAPIMEGHASLTHLTLSGISARLQSPSEGNPAVGDAAGGQQEIILVSNRDGSDRTGGLPYEFTLLDGPWNDTERTIDHPGIGSATYHVDNMGVQVTQTFIGEGGMHTEGGRFGHILAGETGDLTITVDYALAGVPGALTSIGRVDIVIGNDMSGQMDSFLLELPSTGTGTWTKTMHFNAGDTG